MNKPLPMIHVPDRASKVAAIHAIYDVGFKVAGATREQVLQCAWLDDDTVFYISSISVGPVSFCAYTRAPAGRTLVNSPLHLSRYLVRL